MGGGGWEGDVDILNLRSSFLPEVELFFVFVLLFFGKVRGEGRPLLHSR